MPQQLWKQLQLETADQLVGNADALSQLRTCTSGLVLISGPYGCGKTSLAQAYAHELTGLKVSEENAARCGSEGKWVKYINAKVFDVDNLTIPYFSEFYKMVVLIVDEAQYLTPGQQAKLKTCFIDERVLVLFCTTDPQLLEEPIRDRCVRIRLGPLPAKDVPALVKRACVAKNISFDPEITRALVRSDIFRPRGILNVVDAIARGVPITRAVTDQD